MRTAKQQPRNEALDLIARHAALGQQVLALVKESGLARPPKRKVRMARAKAVAKAPVRRATKRRVVTPGDSNDE